MSAPEEIRSTRSTQAIQAFPFNGDDPDSVIALRSAYDRGRAERNIIDRETLWRLIAEHHQTGATCRCGFYPRLDYNRFSQHIADEILASCHVPLVATREAVRSAVGAVLANASSFPEPVMRHILGCDMGPLIEKTTDALFISGALVDASASAPTREEPTDDELITAYSVAASEAMNEETLETGFGSSRSRRARVAGLRAVVALSERTTK